MKNIIVVQARMSSSRLPGKVLRTVLGKPLLEFEIERLRRVKGASEIVVATTSLPGDDGIAVLCERLKVACYRGDEQDVLGRYYEAARPLRPDAVVRVTGDCPLIDPEVVDLVITRLADSRDRCAYASNVGRRTYPRGLDCEAFTFTALEEAAREAKLPNEREHVTPFIRTRPERYPVGDVTYSRDCSAHRWTVDTPEDFKLISLILEALYPRNPRFTFADALELVERRPEWSAINAEIEQKKWDQFNTRT